MLQNIAVKQRRGVTRQMLQLGTLVMGIAMLCHAAEHGVLTGTVVDVGSATKTVVVKTADGTEHSLQFAGHTTVHGTKEAARGTGDAFHGLEKGNKVVVHYTAEGGKETADEVGKVGDDGLKAAKVTVTHFDKGAKTVAVKTADGTKETFVVTGRAGEEIGKGVAKGSEDAAKGTIYFTEKSGQKIAHFFERM